MHDVAVLINLSLSILNNFSYLHGKNSFAKKFRILANTNQKRNFVELSTKIIVKHSNQWLEHQNFLQHRSLLLRFQQNYFDATKIFSDQYPAKFFDSSAKPVLSV